MFSRWLDILARNRARVTFSCLSFFLPSILMVSSSNQQQTTFSQAGMFVTDGTYGYFEERLRRQFAWGTTRGNTDALWDPIKIFAGWPGAESKKSYQRGAAVTLRHFEVGCSRSLGNRHSSSRINFVNRTCG